MSCRPGAHEPVDGLSAPSVLRYGMLGKPIPLTDPGMTRFFMSVEQAVDLVLAALDDESTWGGKTMSADRPRSAYVLDFIEVCRDLLGVGQPIEQVGMRPGERLHEWHERDGKLIRSDDPACLMSREELAECLRSWLDRTVIEMMPMKQKVPA